MPPVADNIRLAFGIVMVGSLCIVTSDTIAKVLTADLSVMQIIWIRFTLQSLLLTPLVLYRSRRLKALHFNQKALGTYAWCGALIALATIFFYLSLRDNPLPDATAVFFIAPILVMFVAAAFLGEPLRRHRIGAGLLAFVGVLIILRPGGNYSPTILFALLAALLFACYIVTLRAVAARWPPLLITWGTGFFGMLYLAPILFWQWQPPTAQAWFLLACSGAVSVGAHIAYASACRHAPAAIVGLFQYIEIIIAVVLSYFVFSHFPDKWVWLGIAFIVGAKISIIMVEVYGKRKLFLRNP